MGLASGPPGGRRAASALDRATPLVCHTGHRGGQSGRREYPGGGGGQTTPTHPARVDPAVPEQTGAKRCLRGQNEASTAHSTLSRLAPAATGTVKLYVSSRKIGSSAEGTRPRYQTADRTGEAQRPFQADTRPVDAGPPFQAASGLPVGPRDVPHLTPGGRVTADEGLRQEHRGRRPDRSSVRRRSWPPTPPPMAASPAGTSRCCRRSLGSGPRPASEQDRLGRGGAPAGSRPSLPPR